MGERTIQSGRVLIVDDEPPNILLLERTLQQAGFTNVRSTTDSHAVLSIFAEFQPDLLLLDLHMPGLTGFDVMEQLRGVVGKNVYFPILVLTANPTLSMKKQALSYGAKDFLTKPFDLTEVLLRIKNLLETRFLHLQLRDQNQVLEVKVRDRTRDLEVAQVEILQRLSLAAEFRDDATGQHTQRVGRVSAQLAKALGLSDELVQLIRLAAPLHDVGKIGIADAILLKPGGLTLDEFRVVTTHTSMGSQILSGSQSPLLQLAEQIALTHHECWDGGGYPLGLRGEAIPLAGRIVSVADVFDALTHRRPYKEAWLAGDAAAEIERLGRSKFDPRVVEAFLQLFRAGLLQEDAAVGDPSIAVASTHRRRLQAPQVPPQVADRLQPLIARHAQAAEEQVDGPVPDGQKRLGPVGRRNDFVSDRPEHHPEQLAELHAVVHAEDAGRENSVDPEKEGSTKHR